MSRDFGTVTFVMDGGERYCHVVDHSSGLPEYYPCLYLTTQLRNRGDASSTIESVAGHLVVLLRFAHHFGIDLGLRLLERAYLHEHELDALRDFAQHRFRKTPKIPSLKVPSSFDGMDKPEDIVNSGTQYARLTTIAFYLGWLAKHILHNPNHDDTTRINAMVEQLKARRPVRKGRNQIKDRALDDAQIEILFEVIRLGSEHNPFVKPLQRRNRLMILLLFHLGIRGGELLNIRIDDIDMTSQRIRIARRADEIDDPRIRQPNVKTLERLIPLSDNLIKEIYEYITQDRRHVPNARKNKYLFVTHKNGPSVGKPVSKASYHKVMAVVRAVSPKLYAMTGHMLRHTWNYKFSAKMDSMDVPLSEEKQEQIRSFLMGWKPGSGTASTYNKRFIEQKAFDAAISMQESIGIRTSRDFNNEQ